MTPVIPLTVRISALFWKLSSFLIPPERRTRHDRPLNLLPDRSAGTPGGGRRGAPARGRTSGTHGQKTQFSQAIAHRSGDRRTGGCGLVWLGLLDRRPVSGVD